MNWFIILIIIIFIIIIAYLFWRRSRENFTTQEELTEQDINELSESVMPLINRQYNYVVNDLKVEELQNIVQAFREFQNSIRMLPASYDADSENGKIYYAAKDKFLNYVSRYSGRVGDIRRLFENLLFVPNDQGDDKYYGVIIRNAVVDGVYVDVSRNPNIIPENLRNKMNMGDENEIKNGIDFVYDFYKPPAQ
jgi:cbb3-type cytochrome oxidase subunit 3